MTSTAGTIFEGYRLLRTLGEGWLGTVHVAQSLDDAQTQALRVIRPGLCAQPQVITQFRRLFEKWQRLKHPHILSPYALIEHEQHVLYTMPLASSGSVRYLLQSHTREGQFIDLLVAVDIVRQAAEAISYAHNHNLIHGNLKPENLLLSPAKAILGRQAYGVLVSDFGVAELQGFTHGIHDRQIISAPAYMAPEQFKGTRSDLRSDIYSLGVILYELLTNLLPFETKDFAEAADKHLHVAPIPPGQLRVEIPTSVEEIVLTCMAKSPEYRYRSMAEFEEALQRALNELLPRGPKPTIIMPDIPEPPIPVIDPLIDRMPYPRIQVCEVNGNLIRVEPLRDQNATLGRAPSNTFVLEHGGISRHHLSLSVRDDQVYVTDLDSTNGTTLQGLPLVPREETLWPDGSVLRLEPFWLRLQPPQRIVQQARIGVLVKDNDITLVPGQTFTLPIQLANTGKTVDHFRLEVDGVPQEWVQNLFSEVQLNPNTTADASLKIMVPMESKYHAQTYPVRVIARSREKPDDIGYAPMNWKVLPFYRTTTTFKPSRRSAWRKTYYQLNLQNDSNVPVTYHPVVEDDEGEVKLQTPWEQINLPAGGTNLRNLIPVRTIIMNAYLRLREGIGKVKVSGLPAEVTLQPGESLQQRMDVKLPIRWVAAPRQRKLTFYPNSTAEVNQHSALSLQHLPLIPLWALPLVLLAALGIGLWLMQTPKVIVSIEPQQPLPGQAFNMRFQAENAVSVEVKPFNKTVYNTRQPLLIPQGIKENTTVQVIAHGRIKSSQQVVNITVNHPAPLINTFRVYPQNITAGQQATVQWDIGGVKEVQLEPFGTVPNKGERKVTVTEDTVFKLTAKNNGGSIDQEQRIKLLPAAVEYFDVLPDQANIGDKIKIRWRVRNGRDVQLDPVGTVATSGQMDWEVKGNQTFTLHVEGGPQPLVIPKTLTVYAPQIELFSVAPTNAKVGDTVVVKWKTSHAKEVIINPFGTVPPEGEQSYRLTSANNIFSISAGNGVTSVQQQAAVNATVAPPEIVSVSVSPTQAKPNQQIKLVWQTTNAISTELAGLPQGTIALAPNGSTSFNAPSVTTPLTFTARGADGTLTSRTIELAVSQSTAGAAGTGASGTSGTSQGTVNPVTIITPPAAASPTIKRFEATRSSIEQGQSTQLRWVVTGADQIKIFPSGAIYSPNSNILLHPDQTTTYTLIAGNQRQEVTVQVKPKQGATTTVTPPPASPKPPATPNTSKTTTIPPKPVPAAPPKPSNFGQTATPTPPSIQAFTVGKTTLQAGESTKLTWQTRGSPTVMIDPLGLTQQPSGTLNISPSKTTTYSLKVGTQTRQIVVTVVPKPQPKPQVATPAPPAGGFKDKVTVKPTPKPANPVPVPNAMAGKINIVTFKSDDPSGILAGRPSTLRWQVEGTQKVKLFPQNIIVPATGTLKVNPALTTTYSIVAGSETRSLTLKVFGSTAIGSGSNFGTAAAAPAPKPVATVAPTPAAPVKPDNKPNGDPPAASTNSKMPIIRTFAASSSVVKPGSKVTIKWDVDNSKSVYIVPFGRQPASGTMERAIYRTTVFKLDARNSGQVATDSITVRVDAGAGSTIPAEPAGVVDAGNAD